MRVGAVYVIGARSRRRRGDAGAAADASSVAVWLRVWAAVLLVIGLAIERWRYKPLAARPPGPDWQMTDERFVDPETGKLVTVYFQPRTGERRYIAA